jgi:hypothetical protein
LIHEKVLLQKNKLALTCEEGEVVTWKMEEKEDMLELPWLYDKPPFGHGLTLDHHLRCWKCHYLY